MRHTIARREAVLFNFWLYKVFLGNSLGFYPVAYMVDDCGRQSCNMITYDNFRNHVCLTDTFYL